MKSSNKWRQGEELKLSKVAADIPTGETQAIPKRETIPSYEKKNPTSCIWAGLLQHLFSQAIHAYAAPAHPDHPPLSIYPGIPENVG